MQLKKVSPTSSHFASASRGSEDERTTISYVFSLQELGKNLRSMSQKQNKVKVGINGFGRIGRMFFRAAKERFSEDIEICAINDPMLNPEHMAYLIKHDSVYGNPKFTITDVEESSFKVNECTIQTVAQKDAHEIPWKSFGVDVVAECSGLYTTTEKAKAHLESKDSGAKKVVLSAPAKDEVTPTFVMGVNEGEYDPGMTIVSNASCTTNCLAPLLKIVHENYVVEEALMSTIHAVTATQNVVDAPSKKDFRAGRSALLNIIPATTGAAIATTKVLPALSGKLTGMAFRVPVSDVSVVDLTCRLQQPVQSIQDIANAFRNATGTLGQVVGVAIVCLIKGRNSGADFANAIIFAHVHGHISVDYRWLKTEKRITDTIVEPPGPFVDSYVYPVADPVPLAQHHTSACIFSSSRCTLSPSHIFGSGTFIEFEIPRGSLPTFRGLCASVHYFVTLTVQFQDGTEVHHYPMTVQSSGTTVDPYHVRYVVIPIKIDVLH